MSSSFRHRHIVCSKLLIGYLCEPLIVSMLYGDICGNWFYIFMWASFYPHIWSWKGVGENGTSEPNFKMQLDTELAFKPI